jgi:hypothetical protein
MTKEKRNWKLEPISKMWIAFLGWPVKPVEPVKNGKMPDFIFFFKPTNGLTGNGLNPYRVSILSRAATPPWGLRRNIEIDST